MRSAFPADQGGPEGLTIFDDAVLEGAARTRWCSTATTSGPTPSNWAVIATIQAEEFGITADNVEQMTSQREPGHPAVPGPADPRPEDPEAEPAPFDPGLGLEPDFAVNVITQVGNYGEIYDRTVGPATALGLERGLNAQWTDGGLLYAPPYR